jgi:hypothetical protein
MSEKEIRVSPYAFAAFQEAHLRAINEGYDADAAVRRSVLHLGSEVQGWDIGACRIVVDYNLSD